MKSSAKNISLTPLDDLFSTEEERSKDVVGSIVNIPLSHLHDFPNHPFKVRDDEKMQETVESVKAYGVLVPAIVRQRPDGEYEIVAGHRRKRASELAGLNELPAIVRDLDDDAATIIMVDSIKFFSKPVYVYTAYPDGDSDGGYRGPLLFPFPATLLYSKTYEEMICDSGLIIKHIMELWILDDMTFAVVSCVRMELESGELISEYRLLKTKDRDIFPQVIDLNYNLLVIVLDSLCLEHTYYGTPIYEL